MGYPEIRLIKNKYPETPPHLKSFLVKGESFLESLPVSDNDDSIAVIKKYGKSAGKTHETQSFSPLFTAKVKFLLKASIKEVIISKKNKAVSKSL